MTTETKRCDRCGLDLDEGHTSDVCSLEANFEAFIQAIKKDGVGPVEAAVFLARCAGTCFALQPAPLNNHSIHMFLQVAGEQLLEGAGIRGSVEAIRNSKPKVDA